jgi:hypothetical protein
MRPEYPSLMQIAVVDCCVATRGGFRSALPSFALKVTTCIWTDSSNDDEVGVHMTRMGKKRNSCNRAYQIVNRDPSRDT